MKIINNYLGVIMCDDDVGSTEYWRDINSAKQENRAQNRESSTEYLENEKIPFSVHNFGAHLIVEGNSGYIDFWPGTGKWIERKGKKGFGVRNRVNYIKEQK